MKISIIIPVYNVEPYIAKCLQSVAAQTYQGDLECIVVDDCGSDNSIDIANDFVSNYSGIFRFQIIHHEQNKGLPAARNTGMSYANGDYLFFLDSDDLLAQDCIEKLTHPLKISDYDIIVGDFRWISDGKELPLTSMNLQLKDGTILHNYEIISNYRKTWNMVAWNKLVNHSFIKKNNLYFDEGLYFEDERWCFKIACLAQSLYAVNQVTYYYMKWQDTMSSAATYNKKNKHWLESVKLMGTFVKERNLYNKAIHLRLNSFFIRIMNDHTQSLSDYIRVYKDLVIYLRPSLSQLINALGWDIKWYLLDLHYILPKCIAPYWLFYTISKPYVLFQKLKK